MPPTLCFDCVNIKMILKNCHFGDGCVEMLVVISLKYGMV